MSIGWILPLKSGRFLYSTDEEYAGAPIAVTQRHIMNHPALQIKVVAI